MALGLAVRADLDGLRLAGRGLGFIVAAVVEGDLLQASRALEDLAVDGVSRRRLAPAAIAPRLVEPVDLGLDLAFDLLERLAERVGIDGGAVVLGDESRGRAAVDGDGLAALEQGSDTAVPPEPQNGSSTMSPGLV